MIETCEELLNLSNHENIPALLDLLEGDFSQVTTIFSKLHESGHKKTVLEGIKYLRESHEDFYKDNLKSFEKYIIQVLKDKQNVKDYEITFIRDNASLLRRKLPPERSRFRELAKTIAKKMFPKDKNCFKKYRLFSNKLTS